MMGASSDRSPVIGLRQPIIGLRKPIVGISEKELKELEDELEPKELLWDDVYKKFNNYIKYMSNVVGSTSSNSAVVSSEDLYQEGLLMLYECFEKYKCKPKLEFQYLFKASLIRHLRKIAWKPEFVSVEIDLAFDLGYSDKNLIELYDKLRIGEIVDMIKDYPVAQSILKEILQPSSKTLWEVQMDAARKETIHNQGYNQVVPKTLEVTSVAIQRALGITQRCYKDNMRMLRDCVYRIYGVDTVITRYESNYNTSGEDNESDEELRNDIASLLNQIKEQTA